MPAKPFDIEDELLLPFPLTESLDEEPARLSRPGKKEKAPLTLGLAPPGGKFQPPKANLEQARCPEGGAHSNWCYNLPDERVGHSHLFKDCTKCKRHYQVPCELCTSSSTLLEGQVKKVVATVQHEEELVEKTGGERARDYNLARLERWDF